MPRQVSKESGTGIYHVMLRGINRLEKRNSIIISCLEFGMSSASSSDSLAWLME